MVLNNWAHSGTRIIQLSTRGVKGLAWLRGSGRKALDLGVEDIGYRVSTIHVIRAQ